MAVSSWPAGEDLSRKTTSTSRSHHRKMVQANRLNSGFSFINRRGPRFRFTSRDAPEARTTHPRVHARNQEARGLGSKASHLATLAGIETSQVRVLDRLTTIVNLDWRNSVPIVSSTYLGRDRLMILASPNPKDIMPPALFTQPAAAHKAPQTTGSCI